MQHTDATYILRSVSYPLRGLGDEMAGRRVSSRSSWEDQGSPLYSMRILAGDMYTNKALAGIAQLLNATSSAKLTSAPPRPRLVEAVRNEQRWTEQISGATSLQAWPLTAGSVSQGSPRLHPAGALTQQDEEHRSQENAA